MENEEDKENDTKTVEDGNQKRARIQLDSVPRTLGCSAPSSIPSSQQTDETGGNIPGCRPLAVLLRLRVTQIVAGILFVLLGTVACLEDTTRYTLSVAIPAGFLSVLTAVINIQANRKEYGMGLLGVSAAHTSSLMWSTRTLRSRILTLLCTGACLVLLSLACLAASSRTNKNQAALGCLQALTSMTILGTEAAVIALRWHWATKHQST
ncbi:uncharacterized protein LOC111618987 [Centruroides sculpturatus]|uniref:uncharacterized protein LOC111618987 n=1 Tax=Centruroides sculpturatus TaxID=218467 RepID=UPI000C6E419B|nr:uncharacterized protein LOC111618987 [Centruroides sculpturatus]